MSYDGGFEPLTALPYEFYDPDEYLVAVRAQGMTRGKARAWITREREEPFTSGHISIQWFVLDEGRVVTAQPHQKGALAYWYYD